MPGPSRILIVDDSVVVRRMLSDLVSSDPDLELAGTASNGQLALQKLPQLAVDLVVMDVEMPGMDGIEAVGRIRVDWPRLPVMMCSSLTARGADATLRALAAGATDYVAKPSGLGNAEGLEGFKREFVAKLKGLAGLRRSDGVVAMPVAPQRPISNARRTPSKRPAVLAIGCSTGGPNALARVFADLPGDIGVPIVITQHMPPLFTRMLAERLTATSAIPVKEAETGDELLPNHAYIAPGDYHMALRRDGVRVRVVLNQDPPENSCRPAVDVMFRSVAALFGPDVIAAVMTGMGQDGAVGSRHVADAGGWVITQDAASCVVPSMPNAVVAIGASHESAELEQLGTLFGFRCKPAQGLPSRWTAAL
ncbi:MAG: chemotaxis response regulator protein-glutamate methylesterase [Deltaproteobacteria bacterium]|nr:chemotaxis response regulator protein-glutamate methylesterase [Deltaproteobacteria bacterium]MBK8716674.1 chemotaxis response regulator protein-glutamate methylesterase [Deltaproteobacteria bacterium]MBP7285359.1 chemotaxis response regulator protein-glutamate methylesterase [Nannocystaceae bacterium]